MIEECNVPVFTDELPQAVIPDEEDDCCGTDITCLGFYLNGEVLLDGSFCLE